MVMTFLEKHRFAGGRPGSVGAEAVGAGDRVPEDAIGVLVKDRHGVIKEHKLGRRAGKRGMGIGVALGVIAAIPTGGLSLVGGALAGAAGGGVIGEFFHKGIKITNQELARIGRELDAGHAAVGVLSWDSETDAMAAKLAELGGTSQTHAVATLSIEDH
jgi:Protein of unknown function (DUF1269)